MKNTTGKAGIFKSSFTNFLDIFTKSQVPL